MVPASRQITDQRYGIESPEITAHTEWNGFQRGWHDHSLGEKTFSQRIVLGKRGVHMQENEAGPHLAQYTQTDSKWIHALSKT